MAIKCPKCHSDNPEAQTFCGKCGTKLPPAQEIGEASTRTLRKVKEELSTGSTFAGRYQIIEELGKGGMGRVYKAFDTEIKEKVALKLLNPEIATDQETVERFRNELKFARKIRHKNVCQMFDLNKEEGALYITMEYVHGDDLKQLIRKVGHLSPGQALVVAKQVCEGLAEAHRLGVVHRDLKPHNIMVDDEGNARIMDFGIARSIRGKGVTGAGVMIGTPEYMSPEQVEGKEADKRSDIYALGVVLYEMLTGRVPFEGDTPLSVAYKHKNEPAPDPRETNAQIPEDFSRLVLRCLEKEQEKRYQSAEDVLADLRKIEKGLPTTERVVLKRKPSTSREITVILRLKKLVVPVSVFLAVIVIGLIIWKVFPRKAPVKSSVAVISFKNQTGDKTYDYLQEAIPNLLITSLEQSKYLRVITWERMKDLLKQMGQDRTEVIDEDVGFEICRRDGIEAIVLGSFVKAGEVFATDAKVLDVSSKRLLRSVSARGDGVSSILKTQIDELSRNISRGIGISERTIKATQPKIAEVATNSMEAYNFFLRGREDYEKFYFEDALKFLEKAVELDPTFAVVYLYLARTQASLGNQKASNDAFEKAKTLSNKATEKDRLNIEASYALAIERNPDKRIRILQELAQKYPEEKRVHFDLGTYYQNRQMFPEALSELAKAIELDPKYGYAINQLAYVHALMGNYEKALGYFQRYAAVSPGDANPVDSLAELYVRMGNLDDAIAKYKEVLQIKPGFFSANWKIAYVYGLKEDYAEALKSLSQPITSGQFLAAVGEGHWWRGMFYYLLGSLDKSLGLFQAIREQVKQAGTLDAIASAEWIQGWINYEKGDFEATERHLQSWVDLSKKINPVAEPGSLLEYNFCLGLADLKRGRIDSAKSRLAEINSYLSNKELANSHFVQVRKSLLETEILLAEGSAEKVIAICKSAAQLEMPSMTTSNLCLYNVPFLRDVLARGYLKKGDNDKAIAEYERLITISTKQKDRALIDPRYHYRLAKLYEEKRLKAKAIEQYQKFLDIWKDADPSHPELGDAKKRLPVLQGNN
jgi:serine/threonine protein kinase/Flp pilus assembly protein TadD